MNNPIIKRYADHWERDKMFSVQDGRVEWTPIGWPDKDPPLQGAKGIYVLYSGHKPIYVGIALNGADPIAKRIHDHTKDWLAPWWDSVCWYDFGKNIEAAQLVESFLISHGVDLWNGAESGGEYFGEQAFLEGRNYASIDLWRSTKT